MNRKEAALAKCILDCWKEGFGQQLLRACGLDASVPDLAANVRLPRTDIAWRELDLLSEPFSVDGEKSRLVVELKNGGLGYRSMAQVIFYKHVFLPRHLHHLEARRVVFVAIGSRPNPQRWNGRAAWESDADEFLALLKSEYWPDSNIHAFSYDQLGLAYSGVRGSWHWSQS